MEEDQEDRASKENLPIRSGRKEICTLRENHVNRDIMMRSQQTIFKMMGGSKPPKFTGSNETSKGGSYQNPPK
jgi:hypothetical protein